MALAQSVSTQSLVTRKSYARLPQILEVPNLIEIQLDSFRWFHEEGLKSVLEEVSPIDDFTGNRLQLTFVAYEFREPRHSERECRQRDFTYSAPLYVRARLLIKQTGEIKEQDLFLGDVPMMTAKGTFITSGAERVVVSQLLRSPGVYFSAEEDPTTGATLCHAKLISNRGAWLEFDTATSNVMSVKINGKRKIPVTTLLRAIGYGDDQELLGLYHGVSQKDRGFWYGNTLPDRIIIYRRPLERISSSLEDLRENIRQTVIHEIGHYFGFDEEELRRLEEGDY